MEDYTDWLKAGKTGAAVREHARKIVKPGVKLYDVAEELEALIIKKGAGIAFPANISQNNIAAHYTPSYDDETVFGEDDLVKIDVGIHVNGAIADSAITIDLGNKHEKLVEASKAALAAAIRVVKTGVTLSEVGRAISHEITSRGFQPVRNLSGHGVARFQVHTPPSVPNYDTKHSQTLERGMIIAIEPFASTGVGMIKDTADAEIFEIQSKKPVRDLYAKQVLKAIQKYNGLPFAARWLCKEMNPNIVQFGIKRLVAYGVLQAHSPLPEVTKGAFISQAEHTMIVEDEGAKVTTLYNP